LFHCYDDPRIPQTNNSVEACNGRIKSSLRRCSGRKSTASGPGTSYGRFYANAIVLVSCLSDEELTDLLHRYDVPRYWETADQLRELRKDVGRRRSYLRNPDKFLSEIKEKACR
jgi:hypothetical protein